MIGIAPDRGLGEFTLVESLPDFVVVAFAAVTHLADPWFLFGLLALVYWLGTDRLTAEPRRVGATTIAIVTCTYALVALGKAWVAVPRPPGAMGPVDVPAWLPAIAAGWYETQVLSDGFGFPSGHAAAGIAAYLSLALLVNRLGTRRVRLLAAGIVAIAVAASRVVIAVHFLVDVIVGILVGVIAVIGGLWAAGVSPRRWGVASDPDGHDWRQELDPRPTFLLAAVISVIAAGIAFHNGHSTEVVEAGIGIAAGVGGAIGWQCSRSDEPPVTALVAAPALGVTGGLWVGAYTLSSAAGVTFVATTVAVTVVIALPALSLRWAGTRE